MWLGRTVVPSLPIRFTGRNYTSGPEAPLTEIRGILVEAMTTLVRADHGSMRRAIRGA